MKLGTLVACLALVTPQVATAAEKVDFRRDVLPLLKQHCYACHSDATNMPKAALRLDNRKGVSRHVEPGDPDQSNLLDRITRSRTDVEAMPPDGPIPPMSPTAVATLRAWIAQGADFGGFERYDHGRYTDYPVAPPKPVNTAAAAREIDRLVEARIAATGKTPNPPADDPTFLRRVYLDVVGRVPTVAEAERFLGSTDPNRRAKLIDELLASEGYVSRFYHLWADALRAKTHFGANLKGDLYV